MLAEAQVEHEQSVAGTVLMSALQSAVKADEDNADDSPPQDDMDELKSDFDKLSDYVNARGDIISQLPAFLKINDGSRISSHACFLEFSQKAFKHAESIAGGAGC